MYESVQRIRETIEARLSEIDREHRDRKPVVHNTVRALRGRLRRVKLPSGVNAYRIATRARNAA